MGFGGQGRISGTERRRADDAATREQLQLDASVTIPRKLDALGILHSGDVALVKVKVPKGSIQRALVQVATHGVRYAHLMAQGGLRDTLGAMIDQKAATGVLPPGCPRPARAPRIVPCIAAPDRSPDWPAGWNRALDTCSRELQAALADLIFIRLHADGRIETTQPAGNHVSLKERPQPTERSSQPTSSRPPYARPRPFHRSQRSRRRTHLDLHPLCRQHCKMSPDCPSVPSHPLIRGAAMAVPRRDDVIRRRPVAPPLAARRRSGDTLSPPSSLPSGPDPSRRTAHRRPRQSARARLLAGSRFRAPPERPQRLLHAQVHARAGARVPRFGPTGPRPFAALSARRRDRRRGAGLRPSRPQHRSTPAPRRSSASRGRPRPRPGTRTPHRPRGSVAWWASSAPPSAILLVASPIPPSSASPTRRP